MIKAIVYKSCTGFTKQYAEILGKETGLGYFSLDDRKIDKGSEIIFLGWLNAGKITGLGQALAEYNVRAVCGVGMAETGAQILDMRKRNAFPDGVPVFSLQGGFDMEKLPGRYKFMMKILRATHGRKLASKKDRTPGETDMLDMLMNGGSRVGKENLSGILDWYEKQK